MQAVGGGKGCYKVDNDVTILGLYVSQPALLPRGLGTNQGGWESYRSRRVVSPAWAWLGCMESRLPRAEHAQILLPQAPVGWCYICTGCYVPCRKPRYALHGKGNTPKPSNQAQAPRLRAPLPSRKLQPRKGRATLGLGRLVRRQATSRMWSLYLPIAIRC